MGRNLTRAEIFELSVPERLQLIESLWDSIGPNDLPLAEAHKEALDQSMEEYESNRDGGRSWEEVRNDLFRR